MGAVNKTLQLGMKFLEKKGTSPDPSAHTIESFTKLGEEVTDPVALAAHTARGREGYMAAPGDKLDISEDDLVALAGALDRERTDLANPAQVEAVQRLAVERKQPADALGVEEILLNAIGEDQYPKLLAGSRMKLKRPLYVMRTDRTFSDVSWKEGGPQTPFSFQVVDPSKPLEQDAAGRARFAGQSKYDGLQGDPRNPAMTPTEIFKLPAGTKILHPAGKADKNEVLVQTGELRKIKDFAPEKDYMEALQKGSALFTAGGVIATSSDNAQAQEFSPELTAKVQAQLEKMPAGLLRKALVTKHKPETVDAIILSALQPKITAAREAGMKDEQILAAFQAKGFALDSLGAPITEPPEALAPEPSVVEEPPADPMLPEVDTRQPMAADGTTLNEEQQQTEAAIRKTKEEIGAPVKAVLAKLKNVKLSYAQTGKELVAAAGLTPALQAEVKQAKAELNTSIKANVENLGFKVLEVDDYGAVTIEDPNTGKPVTYEEDFLDSMLAGAYELGFAGLGMWGGGAAGAAFAAGLPLPTQAKLAAEAGLSAGGAVIGGMGGAALGRGIDIVRNANDLHYEVSMNELLAKMNDAGVADFTLGALGLTASKLASGVARGSRAAGRGLGRAYDLFVTGNKEGAQQTLKEVYNLNDAQVIDMVTKWETLTGQKVLTAEARQTGELGLGDADATMRVITETLPGAHSIVAASVTEAKAGGAKLSAHIDARAKDLQRAVSAITNENIDVVLQDKLGAYVRDTKDLFESTKVVGKELMADTGYKFKFKETAITPALESSVGAIHNGALRRDFVSYLDRIKDLKEGDASPRSFDNLLELRQTVNELRGDTRFKGFVNQTQMKQTIQAIDAEITSAATKHMPDGASWLKHWKQANTEYHKMKNLESNVLYKALVNPRVGSDTAVRAITRSMSYTDPSTFMQVLGKLPPKTRRSTEGAVLKHLLSKHTYGDEGGKQAVHLPALAAELEKIAFTQPEARNLKRVVKDFAGVFKNDPHLLSVTGSVPLPKFQAFLTADPGARLKYEFASTAFHAVKSRIPFSTNAGRAALVNNVGKLLDNPLNAKGTRELLRGLPSDPELKTALHNLAVEFTKRGKPENYGKTPIYRVHKAGEYNKASSTKIGKGVLHFTDKATAEKIAKQTGSKVKEVMQLHKRIATPEDAARILGIPVEQVNFKDPKVALMLKDKDWAGLAVDDKVLLFKD